MPDADVRRYVVGMLDKLAEARFFLRKVETAAGHLECGHYVSAFGSACYSLRQCLIKCSSAFPAAKDWWSKKVKELEASPMGKYFHDGRNNDIHEGFGLVSEFGMELFELDGEFTTRESWALAETETPVYLPGPLAQECREYFESMVRIALEGYRHFAPSWDPEAAYAPEFGRFEREELRPIH